MLIDTQKAAEYLGRNIDAMTVLRSRGTGCPYVRGERGVLYDTRDLDVYRRVSRSNVRGPAAVRVYSLQVFRDGELLTVIKRRGQSLAAVVEQLMLFPSFQGCSVKESPSAKVSPSLGDKLRAEFAAVKSELKAAFMQSATGSTPGRCRAGDIKADRLIDRAIRKAMK